jgi:large conductance mechanosensitive channel
VLLQPPGGIVKGFLKEFRDFAVKGNLIEVAVGLVLALAFTALINTFIADLVTPIIAAIFGKPDFSGLSFTINESRFLYGDFINAAITFISVAVVLFLVLRAYNAMKKPAEEAGGPSEIELLTEIRDSLKK